jgi:hypothetical protein
LRETGAAATAHTSGRSLLHFVVGSMVTFKIAFGRLDRIIDRIRLFVGRTTNVAFVAIPGAPHRPGLAFFDVYRIPDAPFGVIVLMDFLYRHRTSFRFKLTFASNHGAHKFAVYGSPFAVPGSRLVGGKGLVSTARHAFGAISVLQEVRTTVNCKPRTAL